MSQKRRFHFPACLVLFAALAACVPAATPPPPQPTPPPRPIPAPPPHPDPAPAPPVGWQDGPLSTGDWTYSGGGAVLQATYAGPNGPLLVLRCDSGRQIRIFRPAAAAGAITIATTFGQRVVPPGNDGQAPATLPASDPLFDQIAFSRGRILVREPAGGDLVLPSWPEPARLIEDCRA